jgi:hypothetical protein
LKIEGIGFILTECLEERTGPVRTFSLPHGKTDYSLTDFCPDKLSRRLYSW